MKALIAGASAKRKGKLPKPIDSESKYLEIFTQSVTRGHFFALGYRDQKVE